MLAETVLVKEQCCSLLAEAALAEYDAQTKASRDAAAVEVAKHSTMLVVEALAELEAVPKLWYGGSPPIHFFPAAHRRRGGQARCRHSRQAMSPQDGLVGESVGRGRQ
jgi:hypothetical protein